MRILERLHKLALINEKIIVFLEECFDLFVVPTQLDEIANQFLKTVADLIFVVEVGSVAQSKLFKRDF